MRDNPRGKTGENRGNETLCCLLRSESLSGLARGCRQRRITPREACRVRTSLLQDLPERRLGNSWQSFGGGDALAFKPKAWNHIDWEVAMAIEKIDWSDCPLVEVKPGVQSGAPVLRGTRMPADAQLRLWGQRRSNRRTV